MNSLKEVQNNTELIAGKDYPQTYREFVTMFADDKSCREFLFKLRWNNNFVCPKCKVSSVPWHQTHKRLVCPKCRHQTTVTTGTIFDKTRTPLTTWLEAAWHITTAKNGMSAKTIEQTLGILSTPDYSFTPAGLHSFSSKNHRYSQGIVAQVNE